MNDQSKEFKVKAGAKTRTIHVDYLARVEGEGALFVQMKDGKVEDVKLKIFEPPRFFEALLRGRQCDEAPDITSRICGICPVAYQMSSTAAIENGLGVSIPQHLQQLRRLLYCGEWIESHTLHMYMLHAPDFLGYDDAIQMSKDHPQHVKRGLHIQKAGNAIIQLLGGREIHPINAKVGGFYQLPVKEDLEVLKEKLKKGRDDAQETVEWVNQFDFPSFEKTYNCVSLVHPDEYPMARGRVASTTGLDIPVEEYDQHFEEEQVPYSNALHSKMKDQGAYLTGPMARYNLNRQKLSPIVQEMIKRIRFEENCRNPYRMIIIRALEVLNAFDEAIRIIDSYDAKQHVPSVEVSLKRSTGFGATEAPRGLLYHRYRLDEKGLIEDAKIVPPTSQSQKVIEDDLRELASGNIGLSDSQLTKKCEQVIRNFDPCISCSAHFLKLERTHV